MRTSISARCSRRTGRTDEAIEAYRQVVRLRPEQADGYRQLGAVCLKAKRYAEASQSLVNSLRFDPTNAQARHDLGVAYHYMGDPDLAAEEYKQLRNIDKGLANKLFDLINL